MAVRVVDLSNRGTKSEKILPKNQQTQRRIGLTGSLSGLQKSEFLKFI